MLIYAPTDQEIADAQERVVVLTKRRELCTRLEVLQEQVRELESQLRDLPITAAPPRKVSWLERTHRRVGLA